MGFRTIAPVTSHTFNMTAGGRPMGDPWTLPAGSRVQVVKGFHGGTVDAFAAADIAQLKTLSGNTHDPVYRWMPIAADNVEATTDSDTATVERIRASERR